MRRVKRDESGEYRTGRCHYGGSLSLRPILNPTVKMIPMRSLSLRWQPFIEAYQPSTRDNPPKRSLSLRWQPFIEAQIAESSARE